MITQNIIKELYFTSKIEELTKRAEQICLKNYGKKIFLRGLLEFSNDCKMNCLYCGIRKENHLIKRYFMQENEIIKVIKKNYDFGFRTFVLQSGEFIEFKFKDLCEMIEKIKNRYNDIAITLSCGFFNKKQLKILRNIGVDRYLLKFEIADEKIYSYLKNGLKLKKRIEMLYNLKELGFETGSGFMIGLPDETDDIIIKNIKLCYDLNLDMIGIGPFIPNPNTPLKEYRLVSFDKIIKITSIIRILLPFSNIPATTASGTAMKNGREKLLKAGANVMMINITPFKYKKYYELYPSKICKMQKVDIVINYFKKKLRKINREISFELGQSINYKINTKGVKNVIN